MGDGERMGEDSRSKFQWGGRDGFGVGIWARTGPSPPGEIGFGGGVRLRRWFRWRT